MAALPVSPRNIRAFLRASGHFVSLRSSSVGGSERRETEALPVTSVHIRAFKGRDGGERIGPLPVRRGSGDFGALPVTSSHFEALRNTSERKWGPFRFFKSNSGTHTNRPGGMRRTSGIFGTFRRISEHFRSFRPASGPFGNIRSGSEGGGGTSGP